MSRSRRYHSRASSPALIAGFMLVASAAACRPTAEPSRTPQAKRAPHVLVFAPGPPPAGGAVPESHEQPPEPTATYPSLQAACAVVNAVMQARLGVEIERADSV